MLPDGLHGKEEDLCLIATPQEVAAVMLVDESTVRRACADGMMPDGSVFRVGNLWRIAPDVAYPGIDWKEKLDDLRKKEDAGKRPR